MKKITQSVIKYLLLVVIGIISTKTVVAVHLGSELKAMTPLMNKFNGYWSKDCSDTKGKFFYNEFLEYRDQAPLNGFILQWEQQEGKYVLVTYIRMETHEISLDGNDGFKFTGVVKDEKNRVQGPTKGKGRLWTNASQVLATSNARTLERVNNMHYRLEENGSVWLDVGAKTKRYRCNAEQVEAFKTAGLAMNSNLYAQEENSQTSKAEEFVKKSKTKWVIDGKEDPMTGVKDVFLSTSSRIGNGSFQLKAKCDKSGSMEFSIVLLNGLTIPDVYNSTFKLDQAQGNRERFNEKVTSNYLWLEDSKYRNMYSTILSPLTIVKSGKENKLVKVDRIMRASGDKTVRTLLYDVALSFETSQGTIFLTMPPYEPVVAKYLNSCQLYRGN